MYLLSSTHINNCGNLTESRNEAVFKSKESGIQFSDKIKNGFTSLLKSISNSFSSLKKIFSLSSEVDNIKNNKQTSMFYMKNLPFEVVENKVTMDDKSSKPLSSDNFDKFKSKMHSDLNFYLRKDIKK